MKVSVVVATYNGEKYLIRQLESIKNQSRQADEVLICDDKSLDDTQSLVKDFIAKNDLKNWRFSVNENNQGYQKNFYNLLKEASGDLIFLSDQDDEWVTEKIERMEQIMCNNRQIQTLNSGIQLIDQDSALFDIPAKKNFYNANFLYSEKPLQHINYFSLSDIIKRNISPGCSMCITREIRDRFINTYNFKLPHDWFLNMLASVTHDCVFLNERLLHYRVHSNNTLGVSDDWGAQSKINAFEKSRLAKISEFEQLLSSFKIICTDYMLDDLETTHLGNYLRARLRFSQKQNLGSLLRLRDFAEYHETATFRGQIWDFVVALGLKNLVYRLFKK